MSTAAFTAMPDVMTPDASKHVNYTLGMLLGVDDFNQEFAYLSGRAQKIARDLIGYGTVVGLSVSIDTTGKGPRVTVSCGTAVTPAGQFVSVQPAQCAYINDWLTANETSLQPSGGSPPGSSQRLYLTLCYKDCAVDPVPIAGEPCRSASDMMAASRLADMFSLNLSVTAPGQQEEDAVRDFVAWMDQVKVTDSPGTFLTLPDFLSAMRAALTPAGSPPDPAGTFHLGSPLAGLHIHTAVAPDYLRAAFRVWVTEIRSLFHAVPAGGCTCDGANTPPTADTCVLLAALDVPVVNVGPGQNWQADGTRAVGIDETRRPVLAHVRLLQEWLMSGFRTT